MPKYVVSVTLSDTIEETIRKLREAEDEREAREIFVEDTCNSLDESDCIAEEVSDDN